MKLGLVSVTYRSLTPAAIVELSVQSGIQTIEWGGDIHVPHGDKAIARSVGELTRQAGLQVSAYGSYYRLAVSETDGLPFEKVLSSAVELGAPTIRVWAGNKASANADEAYREKVAEDALRVARMAQQAQIGISYEYHGGTLTDSIPSTTALLHATPHPGITTFWQPPVGKDLDHCLESLRSVLDRLRNVHVFNWWPDANTRLPLKDGSERWLPFLEVLRKAQKDPDLLLEFVPKDEPAVLAREVATLKNWIAT